MCVVDKIAAFFINGKSEGFLEFQACSFGKPYVRVGGLDESKNRGRKEGRLCSSAVSDGLDGDHDVAGDVFIQSKRRRVRNESRGIVSTEDQLSILPRF